MQLKLQQKGAERKESLGTLSRALSRVEQFEFPFVNI
jgi:hypothetical protein